MELQSLVVADKANKHNFLTQLSGDSNYMNLHFMPDTDIPVVSAFSLSTPSEEFE